MHLHPLLVWACKWPSHEIDSRSKGHVEKSQLSEILGLLHMKVYILLHAHCHCTTNWTYTNTVCFIVTWTRVNGERERERGISGDIVSMTEIVLTCPTTSPYVDKSCLESWAACAAWKHKESLVGTWRNDGFMNPTMCQSNHRWLMARLVWRYSWINLTLINWIYGHSPQMDRS